MTGTKLSKIARAQVYVTKGGEVCFNCRRVAKPGELWIGGTSLNDMRGYIGGLFCLSDWLPYNDHPHNRKVIEMEQSELDKLGVPNLRKFSEVVDTSTPWELTHTQIVNLEVIILKMESITTSYGDAVLGTCIVRGVEKKVLFGAKVLVDQLNKARGNLPLLAKVIKPGKYYQFE